MSDVLGAPTVQRDRAQRLVDLYARCIAMLLLGAGLWRAAQIVGITPDGKSLMSLNPAWRAATVVFAFIDLFAAVGLWIGAAWGVVMWSVIVLVQVAMHTLLADRYGSEPLLMAGHVGLFLVYLGLVLWAWRRTMRE